MPAGAPPCLRGALEKGVALPERPAVLLDPLEVPGGNLRRRIIEVRPPPRGRARREENILRDENDPGDDPDYLREPRDLFPVARHLRPPAPLGSRLDREIDASVAPPRESREEVFLAEPDHLVEASRPERASERKEIDRLEEIRLALRVPPRDEIERGREGKLRLRDVAEINDVGAPDDHPPSPPPRSPEGHPILKGMMMQVCFRFPPSLAGFTTAALSGRSRRKTISSPSIVRRMSRT